MDWLGPVVLVVLLVNLVVTFVFRNSKSSTSDSDSPVLTEKLRAAGERVRQLEEDQVEISKKINQLNEELVTEKTRARGLEIRTEERNADLKQLEARMHGTVTTLDDVRKDLSLSKEHAASLKTALAAEEKQSTEKIALLLEAKDQMKKDFQALAVSVLDENSKKFSVKNEEDMANILSPLREQIGAFRQKIEEVHGKDTERFGEMMGELNRLRELNQKINEEASNLTKALKGQSKVQGDWGEMILERVLEMSGLENGREYQTQTSYKDEAGKRYLPDVIIHLPDERDVIVDSKVSLVAYERYCSSNDETERQGFLKAHVKSMEQHIEGLSGKKYEDLEGIRSLDYVLMFVPIEAALFEALAVDVGLFESALKKRIMLVSPTNLHFALKIIANLWQRDRQDKHAQKIADKAGALYDKFVDFESALQDVGKNLERAKSSYEVAHKRLSSGSGNLVRRTEDLKALGLKSKKQLPEALVELASQDSE